MAKLIGSTTAAEERQGQERAPGEPWVYPRPVVRGQGSHGEGRVVVKSQGKCLVHTEPEGTDGTFVRRSFAAVWCLQEK